MMPPTSIDGTDITGATIDGTDVQEITVDGQTVFTSASIPNSAIHQWPLDEGSGTTIGDEIGTMTGTLTGGTWITGTYYDGNALDLSTSDFIGLTTTSAGSNSANFSVCITLEIDDLTVEQEIWTHNLSNNDRFGLGAGRTSGVIACSTFNGSSLSNASVSSAATTNRIRVGVRHRASDRNIDIFVDGVNEVDGTNRVGLSSDTGHRIGDRPDGIRGYSGVVDNPIMYNTYLSDQEMEDDFKIQPWS